MNKKYVRAFLTILLLIGLLYCGENEKKTEPVKQEDKTTQKELPPPEETGKLIGSWIRPDGGYNLQILAFTSNTVDAAYYNPNPIMVSDTQWKIQEGIVYIFVKFDDVGYKGSYYSLEYNPEKDILMGYYYQAAMDQTFDVYFEREIE